MGRLFWKFFAFIWLAQLAGLLAVGSIFWLSSRHHDQALAGGPMVEARLHAGAAVLRHAGLPAFEEWESQLPGPPVYALGADGEEALHRPVAPALLSQLPGLAPDSHRLLTVRSAEGADYRLFMPEGPRPEPSELRRGSPPGAHGRPFWPRTLPPPPTLLATLAGSILTALLLARYVAKPIRSLRSAFLEGAEGNLDRQVAAEIGARHDELADLGRDFDRMMARLKSAMQAQRQLLHDVSHELRAPLARLQAAVSLLRQDAGQPPPLLTRIEDETERIDRLVGDLLRLSRLEAGESPGRAEPIAMDDLVRAIVEDANLEAATQQRQVVAHLQSAATLTGHAELLHRAIENLVRNALKHAPQSRTVTVESRVDAARREYALAVLDDGPGVPAEDLPQLTRPFFRSVSRANGPGYGLGLAIAQRSVEAHGGRLEITNRPEGGLCAQIRLPLTPGRAVS